MYAGGWWPSILLEIPLLRLLVASLSVIGVVAFAKPAPTRDAPPVKASEIASYAAVFVAALVIAVALNARRPIDEIVFDESHGEWEPVTASFGPADFGRDANYAYSMLFEYAGEIAGNVRQIARLEALPGADAAALVIKLPLQPYEEDEVLRLVEWVRGGGRLLMVFDHTDLFDTTRHANPLLEALAGTFVRSDAVFDRSGMPTVVSGSLNPSWLGGIEHRRSRMRYHTGASFGPLAPATRTLATYGLSYSEPANFGNPNRFGGFTPDDRHALGNHPSVIAARVGQGMLIAIGDSTFWSNFSLFDHPNKGMFDAIIRTLEYPLALTLTNCGLLCCLLAVAALMARESVPSRAFAAFALGITISSAAQLSQSADEILNHDAPGLRVVTGERALVEFLPQRLSPTDLSFARSISALGKYQLDPIRLPAGSAPDSLVADGRYLYVLPEYGQLPPPRSMLSAVRAGATVTMLFDETLVMQPSIVTWLGELGLRMTHTARLSLRSSAGKPLLHDDAPRYGFDRVHRVAPMHDSGWVALSVDDTLSSLQPLAGKGRLHVSVAAVQFSDRLLGDVWEGQETAETTRFLEARLAKLFRSTTFEPSVLGSPFRPRVARPRAPLDRYFVYSGSGLRSSGSFTGDDGEASVDGLSIDELSRLQVEALRFVTKSCDLAIGQCPSNFIDSHLREWVLTFRASAAQVDHLELILPRSLSRRAHTYNVVFAR